MTPSELTVADVQQMARLLNRREALEVKVAKVLDDLAEEGVLQSWVKNNFLDFHVPYTNAAGQDRQYYPDFILRASPPGEAVIHLIVEVTGMDRDKPEKRWSVMNRWLPAVAAVRASRGWPRWGFLELDKEIEINDARNRIVQHIAGASKS